MTFADAFAPAEAAHKARVMRETWGHLDATPGVKYRCELLFCYGEYGDVICIRNVLHDGLQESPWFFTDMDDFIARKAKQCGGIYRFAGTYHRTKSGKGRFSGKVKKVNIQWRQK